MRKILIFAFAAAMMLTACRRSAEGVDGNVEDNSPGLFDNKAAQTASSRMSEKLDNSDMSDKSGKTGKTSMSDNSSKSDRDSKSVEVYRSKKMEMPAKMEGTSEILLKREGFFVSYNKDLRIPNWVAWHLTASHTSGDNYRDGQLFTEDNEIPRPRATDSDYYGSTCDRGHMCPSGDNKWSKKAQEESFLFTMNSTRVTGMTWSSSAATGRSDREISTSSQALSSTMVCATPSGATRWLFPTLSSR